MENFAEKWVIPFYWRVTRHDDPWRLDADYIEYAKTALKDITPELVDQMFLEMNWRTRITGAWFAGMKNWEQFTDVIGEHLIESSSAYAGQGYCFALARFSSPSAQDYFVRYLRKFLPQTDKDYDQDWAMAGLMWTDAVLGTDCASEFLDEGGLWHSFDGWVRISDRKEDFFRLMEYSMETFETDGQQDSPSLTGAD